MCNKNGLLLLYRGESIYKESDLENRIYSYRGTINVNSRGQYTAAPSIQSKPVKKRRVNTEQSVHPKHTRPSLH